MIIAPDFVFVHLSKTGGTFAAQTLRELFCPSAIGRKVHRLKTHYHLAIPFYPYRYDEKEQHGLCNDIPIREQNKTIVSCIRNPFGLYVSEYTFDWWKKYPERWFADATEVQRVRPDWKGLNFEDFIDFSNVHASWVRGTLAKYPKASRLGWYTHKFIYYYCRDHEYVFEAADDFDALVARVKETAYPVHFIHTERLNQELYEFLLSKGYPEERVHHIPAKEKLNTSRKDPNWRKWYDAKLRREIEARDALIFHLFPEFQF